MIIHEKRLPRCGQPVVDLFSPGDQCFFPGVTAAHIQARRMTIIMPITDIAAIIEKEIVVSICFTNLYKMAQVYTAKVDLSSLRA